MRRSLFIMLVLMAALFLFSASVIFAEKGEKATLSIICFQGYAEDDWVKPFEEKNNCEVKVTYIGTVEECFAKTKTAPDQYNIVSIDSGRVKPYYDAGLIQAIDVSKVKNFNKMGKLFRTHPYAEMEPGKRFQVPICWGAQAFCVNVGALGKKLDPYVTEIKGVKTLSYKVLKAPEMKNLVAIVDEVPNVTSMSAIAAGVTDNPFDLDDREYKMMINELTAWAKNCRTFTAGFDGVLSAMANEDVYINLVWGDPAVLAELEARGIGDKYAAMMPTEGTINWIDGWVITKPTKGASLELAHKYIDYMIGKEGQMKLAQLVGYGIVNSEGAEGYADIVFRKTPWYAKSIEEFPVKLYIMVAEEDYQRRVDVWNEIKAGLGF
jgi:spermidine/putrescine-binding protein